MVRKLRQMAEGVSENQLAAMIRESTQQIWLAGLGAFAKAQQEGGKVFEALVKEGESVQAKTRKITEDTVSDLGARAAGTWDKLEKVFEDRVARALHSMGVPTKQDIETLSQRVAALTDAVAQLSAGQAPEAAAKPRARTSRKA